MINVHGLMINVPYVPQVQSVYDGFPSAPRRPDYLEKPGYDIMSSPGIFKFNKFIKFYSTKNRIEMPQGITGRALFNLCLCIQAVLFFGVSYFPQDKTQSKHLSIQYFCSPSASVYSVKMCSQSAEVLSICSGAPSLLFIPCVNTNKITNI